MKILFYISTIRGGGAARVMVNIANALCEKNYEICFVTNFPDRHEYELDERIKRNTLEDQEIKQKPISKNIIRILQLRRIIKIEQPDVCIAFMGENNFRLIIAAIGLKTKCIVSIRNDPAHEYPTKKIKKMADILFQHADGIVFQTEDAKKAFPQNIQAKATIIFNQIDEKYFSCSTKQGNRIIACGRLSRQKNYPMMLQAFADVLRIFPDEKLFIFGEGELKDSLIELTKEYGIKESVIFMGYTTDMIDVYQNAKLILMTSDYEGIPNTLLEALASSVPVISTDCPCGGPRMIIRNGENGYLVPVGDSQAFASQVCDVLRNPEQLSRMKESAYNSANAFRPSRILKSWESYIVRIGESNDN